MEGFIEWSGIAGWLSSVIYHHTPSPMDSLMAAVSIAGHYWIFPLIAIAWLIVAVRLKRSGHPLAPGITLQLTRLLLGATIAILMTEVSNLILDFPRPSEIFESDADRAMSPSQTALSSPSKHAVYSSLLAATLWPLLKLRYRSAALLIVLAIGFSRIWLGASAPVDVMIGLTIGPVCAFIAVLITRSIAQPNDDS